MTGIAGSLVYGWSKTYENPVAKAEEFVKELRESVAGLRAEVDEGRAQGWAGQDLYEGKLQQLIIIEGFIAAIELETIKYGGC